MKLLLSWICDHLLDVNIANINVTSLMERFNTHTAEIEHITKISFDYSQFLVGLAQPINGTLMLASGNILQLSQRDDWQNGAFYLIKNDQNSFRYCFNKDFLLDSEALFPALKISREEFETDSWKKNLPDIDYLLEVDNKSLTNRPDMWCHRGFAREISLLLEKKLKPKDSMLENIDIRKSEDLSITMENEFGLKNEAIDSCSGISLSHFKNLSNGPSHPLLALRLAQIGVKSNGMLIDLTNYLLHDWGIPVHGYDAESLRNQTISVRKAFDKERLNLLGNTEVALTEQDLVIADNTGAIALAGIKGGSINSITPTTKNILLEVAVFDATTIRKTAQQHRIRTDSSARYEKSLDAETIPEVIARFHHLAKEYVNQNVELSESVFLKKDYQPVEILVEHSFLEKLSGINIEPEKIISTLQGLEFKVKHVKNGQENIYQVIVPSNRATKNVRTKHDILEEIVRSIGYDKIAVNLPMINRPAYELSKNLTLRKIKNFLAFGANFIEQANYIFYDENFLNMLTEKAESYLEILNPVAENQRRLVSSLFFGLLRNVQVNHLFCDELKFFEIAKIWKKIEKDNSITEEKVLSGIWTSRSGILDFYVCKEIIDQIAQLTVGQKFRWEKAVSINAYPFMAPYQTADLFIDDIKVGVAGMVKPGILEKVDLLQNSNGFFFELVVEPLLSNNFKDKTYQPISKYQYGYVDISCFIPSSVTTALLKDRLNQLHEIVSKVQLLDVFEKDYGEFKQKSMTFRIFMQDKARNIESSDVEMVSSLAGRALEELGVKIR